MGFGLLLCGYFFLSMMSVGVGEYVFATYLIGGVVSLWAAVKLKDYCTRFVLCGVTSVLYILIALYFALSVFNDWFLLDLSFAVAQGTVYSVVELVSVLVEFCHTVFLLWAIYDLSRSLSIDRVYAPALRNILLTGVWVVCEIVLAASPVLREFENQALMKILLLYKLVLYMLIAWLIFRAYRYICPAGEENGKPVKRSRFNFINRLQDKLNEKSERAIRESMAYDAARRAQGDGQTKKKRKKKK